MSSNFYQSWSYTLGPKNLTALFDAVSIPGGVVKYELVTNPPISVEDGFNLRRLAIQLSAPPVTPVTVEITGYIFNQTVQKQTITLGSDIIHLSDYYSKCPSIKITTANPITLNIGFDGGYTPWVLCNSAKTTHMVWVGGSATSPDFTVKGRMNEWMNKYTTAADLKEFNIDATLTNVAASLTYPTYIQMGVGFFRGYVADGLEDDSITWEGGFQMWF